MRALWVYSLYLLSCRFCLADINGSPVLVGLFLNDSEIATIDAVQADDKYYISLALFNQTLKLTPTPTTSGWQYDTVIGTLTLPKTAVDTYQGQNHVDITALTEMGIPVKFDQSNYAIAIYPPWDSQQQTPETPDKTLPPAIDYYPDAVGLNQLRLSGGWYRRDNQRNNQRDKTTWQSYRLGVSGHAFGGYWGSQLNGHYHHDDSQSQDHTVTVDNLYWATHGEKGAIRIGLNSPSYDNVGTDFSGVSLAFSNEGIERHLATFNDSTTTLLRNNYSDFRTIHGEGPVGGIAELRINGRAVARVRIALDKQYEFKNIPLDRLYSAERNVEIALYEHNFANQPIKVIPYLLGERRSTVSTHELLVEVGGGQSGNVWDSDETQHGHYAYGYAEYGLHNNIAIRGGIDKHETVSSMLGVNIGLSQRTNWDIVYRRNETEKSYQSFLSYNNPKLSINHNFEYRESLVQANHVDKKHTLYFYYRPSDYLNFSSNIYHNRYSHQADEDDFTANANIRLTDQLYGSIYRNRDHYVGYRINWDIPSWRTKLSMTSDENQYGYYVDYQLTDKTSVGAAMLDAKDRDIQLYRGYIEHHFSDNHKLYASASYQDQQRGYEIGWYSKINKGLDVSLGYHKNQSLNRGFSDNSDTIKNINEAFANDDSYVYLQFNLSLTRVPGEGFYWAQNHHHNKGSIVTEIDYDDEIPMNGDNVVLLLNNRPVSAKPLANNKYVINNVAAGVYELGLDNKDLPIEYSADGLPTATVKVANGATTVVPYHLEKRLGFSGQLINSEMITAINVYQNGELIKTVNSNPFGYYQVLGLPAGQYQVNAKGFAPINVVLDKEFVFEVDLRRK